MHYKLQLMKIRITYMDNIMKVVIQTVNFIRSRSLNYCQFVLTVPLGLWSGHWGALIIMWTCYWDACMQVVYVTVRRKGQGQTPFRHIPALTVKQVKASWWVNWTEWFPKKLFVYQLQFLSYLFLSRPPKLPSLTLPLPFMSMILIDWTNTTELTGRPV